MRCKRFKTAILYFYGELNNGQGKEFEKHLGKCNYCKDYIKEFQKTNDLYESIPLETPSPHTVERILAKVPAKRFSFLLKPRICFATLSIILLVLGGYFIIENRHKPNFEWYSVEDRLEEIEEDIEILKEDFFANNY